MGIINYFLHSREADELEEVIISSWERLTNFHKKSIRQERVFPSDSYFQQISTKAAIEGDFSYIGAIYQQVKFRLVATQNDFNTLYSMCAELVANINKYYKLCGKMGKDISLKVSAIKIDYRTYMFKLKYCEKHVVG